MSLLESTTAIIVSIISILVSLAVGVRWLVKHYFDEIKHELKPNGGSSIKDQVNRLESQHASMNSKIDHMYDVLLEYISKNNK